VEATDRRVDLLQEGFDLVRVLPDWTAGSVTTTALMPQRRGMLPSVGKVLEFLVQHLAA